MTNLIPINRVHIDYKPSTAAFTATDYFGAVMGVPKELHDLTSKGHFIPKDEDTNLNLAMDGYSKAKRDFWVDTTGVVTVGDTLRMTIEDSFGTSKQYDSVALTGDTFEDLLIKLTDEINEEHYPVVTASFKDEVVTLEALDYVKGNTKVGAAVFNIPVNSDGLATPGNTTHDVTDGHIVAPSAFPSIGNGSVVLTDTVKVISKNTKYFSSRIFNSPVDTRYRILPVKANAALITKRDSSVAKSLDTVNHTYDGTVATDTISRVYTVGSMIEPGSLKITLTDTVGPNTCYITDYASDASEEIVIGTTGIVLHLHGTLPNVANITGSIIDYVAGVVELNIALTGAADIISINSQCFTLSQITKEDAAYTSLKDLKINDVVGLGRMVPSIGYDETAGNASFSGVFPSTAGTHTYTIATPTGYSMVDSKTALHFWVGGNEHIVNKVGGVLAADALISASSFTDNAPTTDFSVTFNAGVVVDGLKLVSRWGVVDAEVAANDTFRFATEETALKNRQVFREESYSTARNENGVTYARVRTVTSCKFGSETLSDVLYFATPIFKKAVGSGINFHCAAEFVTVANEEGFDRTLLDNVAQATTGSDPIQVEETDTNTLGQITFLEAGDEFDIKVTSSIRNDVDNPVTIKPNITLSNFIFGDIYLEYEAEIRDASVINKLIKIDPTQSLDLVYAKIGQPDPRNTIGFGVHLINKVASTSVFYTMPITSESTGLAMGLQAMSFYRDILNVAVLTDEYVGTLDNWIDITNPDGENHPDQSRFRIGYIPHELVTEWFKMGTDGAFQTISDGTLVRIDGDNITFNTTDADVNFLEESIEAGDYFACDATSDIFLISEVFEQELIFQEVSDGITSSTSTTDIKVYRELTISEQAQRMKDIQSSDNSYLTKTLMEEVDYSFDHAQTGEEQLIQLGREFGPIFPFALKISSPPHQPLSFIEFSGFGFGDVAKSSGYFSMNDFAKLVGAGYLVLTNTLGSAPYIIRDVTCGIMPAGIEIEGILSKISPVLHYAKDIWSATRPFIGRYNVTDDVTQAVAIKLAALREYYVTTNYKYLGTLLREASPAELEEVPNGLKISYTVRPQDVLVAIDNYITVVDA